MKKTLTKATITKKAYVAGCAICPGSQASLGFSVTVAVCSVLNVAV